MLIDDKETPTVMLEGIIFADIDSQGQLNGELILQTPPIQLGIDAYNIYWGQAFNVDPPSKLKFLADKCHTGVTISKISLVRALESLQGKKHASRGRL